MSDRTENIVGIICVTIVILFLLSGLQSCINVRDKDVYFEGCLINKDITLEECKKNWLSSKACKVNLTSECKLYNRNKETIK